MTIAAANDIVVTGDVTTDLNGPSVMGLVANNFIRVQHGVTTRSGDTAGRLRQRRRNIAADDLNSLRIDAAMLALNHSFIVDNYDCGSPITGNLTINGAIAQLFRGTVGTTSGGRSVTGYLKNYNYDDRLAVQQPPFFFDLASASWRIVRETSCVAGGARGRRLLSAAAGASTIRPSMLAAYAILAFVGGAVVGSFLTVLAHRLPRGEPGIVAGRSKCPACGEQIAAYDNVPIVSWLLLRGRCRNCGAADLGPLSADRARHRADLRRHGPGAGHRRRGRARPRASSSARC